MTDKSDKSAAITKQLGDDIQSAEFVDVLSPFSINVCQLTSTIVGYYLGSRNLEKREQHDGEVIAREYMIHYFWAGSGPVGVWGSAMLDDIMSRVPVTALIRIVFDGYKALAGGRKMRCYTASVSDIRNENIPFLHSFDVKDSFDPDTGEYLDTTGEVTMSIIGQKDGAR